jgi:hypothetical protein
MGNWRWGSEVRQRKAIGGPWCSKRSTVGWWFVGSIGSLVPRPDAGNSSQGSDVCTLQGRCAFVPRSVVRAAEGEKDKRKMSSSGRGRN